MEDPERSQSEPPQSQSAQTSNATTPSRRHKSPSRQPQSVSPALTQISTSDYGERESTKAEEYGDDYWLNESPTKPKHRHIVVIEEVEEEPVFGDEVASNRDDSLSPAQPSSQVTSFDGISFSLTRLVDPDLSSDSSRTRRQRFHFQTAIVSWTSLQIAPSHPRFSH